MVKDHFITVEELRIVLEESDPNAIIVMSKDSEGNDFRPMSKQGGLSENMVFEPLSEKAIWTGEVYEQDDEDAPEEGAIPCIVLWPIN